METGILNLDRWREAINASFAQFAEQLAIYLPQLMAGIATFLLGWLFAYLFSRISRRLMDGLDSVLARLSRSDRATSERLKHSYGRIVERVVFWMTILFFITVSANVLGWTLFSRWLDSIVSYLPGLLTGILIIMAGFLLGHITRSAIMTTTLKAGMGQSSMMSRSAQVIIVLSAIIIGVEQIGLDVNFLSTLIIVITGTLVAGAALAFSLGARTLVANLLGAQYSRKYCRIGEHLKLGDIEGEVVEIAQLFIVLDTGNGRAVVPARLFQELVSVHSSVHAEDARE
ncbi:MAG: hypothetical protein WEB57_05955 [Pseudohongiellaceae bacterium]